MTSFMKINHLHALRDIPSVPFHVVGILFVALNSLSYRGGAPSIAP